MRWITTGEKFVANKCFCKMYSCRPLSLINAVICSGLGYWPQCEYLGACRRASFMVIPTRREKTKKALHPVILEAA